MPIRYKIDILTALKKKGFSSSRLRSEKLLGEATIQRLRHNQSVSYDVLAKLCKWIECDIGDILMYEEEQK
jgi:putative transcriptional regulator